MRVGSLCTGYGGLDLAVESVLGAQTAWVSEIDKNAAKVCEARFPGVPNLGDLTKIDWSCVEPVDVLTAGYPCQPFSHAGKRQGTDDDRHIWPEILESLRVLRPGLAVFENVAGHLSLGFDTVLADLAGIGFDVEWCVVRASDVGACHQRKRLFILAADADHGADDGQRARPASRRGDPQLAHADCPLRGREGRPSQAVHEPGAVERPRRLDGVHPPADTDQPRLEGAEPARRHVLRPGSDCLTPADPDGDDGTQPDLGTVEPGLRAPRRGDVGGLAVAVDWAGYRPAIERHERLVGRPAPAPGSGKQLDARFVEWMMCLPEGWVTDILPRRPALKALGNGVVPPQAAFAIDNLLRRHMSTMSTCADGGQR